MAKNLKLDKKHPKTSALSLRNSPLTREERIAWLRLIRTPSIGPLTFYHLIQHYGSVVAALEILPTLSKKSESPISAFPLWQAEEELACHEKNGAQLLTALDPDYPPILRTLPDAPPVLSIKGQPSLLSSPILGIVGARNASLHGKRFAENLATALGQHGWVIASGLARGIDTQAHQGALATGTVAVVAGGVDNIYPPENDLLYHQIAEKGVILSEAPWGTPPSSTLFPKRNRIIAGIARGLVVVEAAERSGSLITARYALDQGREVFAVPGSPLDPRCQGSNRLIQEGATLVQTADDILTAFAPDTVFSLPSPLLSSPVQDKSLFLDKSPVPFLHEKILENLSPTPINLDELINVCQLSPPLVLRALTELELAGKIHRLSFNQIVISGLA